MSKKDIAITAILILLNVVGILGIVLSEMGAVYPLEVQGTCHIGAYYEGDMPLNLIDGVRIEFKDFWGYSQVVTTSKSLVNISLYFHGWYRIEAAYKNSTKTTVMTTVKSGAHTYVGIIYIVLDKNENIKSIEYITTPY